MAAPAPPPDAAGHRARLRKRILEQGGEALLDHELVEYLLALAIPRRDTKPLARRLLREFKSLPGVLAAEPEALARLGGLSEPSVAALKVVRAAALRMLRIEASVAPVLAGWQSLLDYLRADMAHLAIERVRVLHLDARNRLLRDELIAEGTVGEAAVHVREVLRRALDLGSTAIVLVHNHPSGDPAPSRQDIALTREIVEAGRALGVAVHDHVIIGSGGHSSMRALGLL